MGGGYYSVDMAWSSRANGAFAFEGPQGAGQGRTGVHPALNPHGKVREVNNETPIIVALDVTRSRGDDTKLMYEKLPELMGQLELKGWVSGPGISFAGIGDANSDRAPLQVGQFEADNRLDEVLERIWIEEGGGGTGQESYELAAWFYSRTNCVRLANGTGGRGFCFFVGDEGFYPKIDKLHVRRIMGENLDEDVDSAEAFRALQEKFNTFLIYPRKSMEDRKSNIDAEIRDRVTRMGGMYGGVDVRASLLWNNRNDLDLHVIAPSGFHIYYGSKQSPCGGWLDVDMNVAGDSTKPVENVRWPKGKAQAGRYRVVVRNFRFHEGDTAPTAFKVEVEVNGVIRHFEHIISPNGQVGQDSDIVIGEFDFDPAASVEETKPDVYEAYSDEVVLKQWESVIPKEHVLKVGDPKSIIDVLMGALAIANGAIDLAGYLADLRDRDVAPERIDDVAAALGGLGRLGDVPEAAVSGEVPASGDGGRKRTTRL